jgi:hypothetical protein
MVDTTIRDEVLSVLEHLSVEQQRALLYFGQAMRFMRETTSQLPPGIPGSEIVKQAGMFSPEDLTEMVEAMKDLERVDLSQW